MTQSKINSIRCKHCNKLLGSATQGCGCIKWVKWNNPPISKKTLTNKRAFKKKC